MVDQNTQQNPPDNLNNEADPLWIWLIAVISITVATASLYGIYTYCSSKWQVIKKANK